MPQTVDSMTRGAAQWLDALGVPYEWSGLCLWLGSESERYAAELVAFGFRWSQKRGAWYWRAAVA